MGNLTTLNLHRGKQAKYKQEEARLYYAPLERRIKRMRDEKKSYSEIANELNLDGIKTRNEREFSAMTVKRIGEWFEK